MKANLLLKQNIDHLLEARGQTRQDLALWCRRTIDKNKANAWISQIFGPKGYENREIQTKYFDRVADFFGIATYQLFQPGISPLTERRGGRDRRTGLDRRVSNRQAQLRPAHMPDMETVTPYERVLLGRIRRMTVLEDRKALEYLIDRALLAQGAGPNTTAQPDRPVAVTPPDATAPHTRKRRRG